VRQEIRHEFDGFRPVAMTGGTSEHSGIERNLAVALGSRLRGRTCQFFGSNLKIEVAGRIRYPDGLVVCTPVARGTLVVANPVVVFEILSESTAHVDLVEKNAEYRATPSIQRYVILQQTHAAAIVFARKGEDWVVDVVAGGDGVLSLPEVGIELPLAELYADVTLVGVTDGA